jgi:hypothetical protein
MSELKDDNAIFVVLASFDTCPNERCDLWASGLEDQFECGGRLRRGVRIVCVCVSSWQLVRQNSQE